MYNRDQLDNRGNRANRVTRADRMRVILMFQDSDIVDAYLSGPQEFVNLAVSKYNDATWIPRSHSLPWLHFDFAEEYEYSLREGTYLSVICNHQ